MKGRRHTPEQVVRKLREADKLLGEGLELPDVLKELEVSEATYHRVAGAVRWDEGRRCEAVEGARGGERQAEPDRGRSTVGYLGAEGAGEGKLLSPARRCRAVLALRERLGMSERRACRLAGQHRSTQRHECVVAGDDAALRSERSCAGFPESGRGGGTVVRINCCSMRAGR
jgi:putative transposase